MKGIWCRFGASLITIVVAIIGSGGAVLAQDKAAKVGVTLRSVKSGPWFGAGHLGCTTGAQGGRPCSDRPQDERSL